MIINDLNKYQQKFKFKDKINYINLFKKKIKNEICNYFSVQEIEVPLLSNRPLYLQSKPKEKRLITFDSYERKGYISFLDDNSIWVKEKLDELEIEIGSGLLSYYKKVNRDFFKFTSIESEMISIELMISDQNANDDFFYDKLINKIIHCINKSIESLGNSFLNKKKMDIKRIKKSSFNRLSKLYLSKKNAIDEFIKKYSEVLIDNISEKYIDEREIFNPFKETNNTKSLYIVNKISKTIACLFNIYTRPDYEVLKNNCEINKIEILDEKKIKKIYSKRSLCIEINFSNLLMYLFNEFSSCESSNTCEEKEIYKFFEQKEIKVF